jgi:site-specific recombinase XerD
MAATIGRRLSTWSSFYRYCKTEDILDKYPALDVRRSTTNHELSVSTADHETPRPAQLSGATSEPKPSGPAGTNSVAAEVCGSGGQ